MLRKARKKLSLKGGCMVNQKSRISRTSTRIKSKGTNELADNAAIGEYTHVRLKATITTATNHSASELAAMARVRWKGQGCQGKGETKA